MLLEELLSVVETLRGRIAAHGPALRQSEALTRYALIDPLLRGLGWDTADPAQVLVEYHSGGGSADYALLGADGKPRIIVEAKRLGTPLPGAVTQGINYCIQQGIPYFALTDGQRWEMYETFQPVPLDEKLVMRLDLQGQAPRTCLDALALWRPSAAVGDLSPAAVPVMHPSSALESPSQTGVVSDGASADGWHTLSEFSPLLGSKPQTIRLPSGEVRTTGNWADLTVEVVRWLYEQGHLKQSHLPIQRDKAKAYIVAATPYNATGKKFAASRQVGPYFVNVNANAKAHVRNMSFIVKLTGQDPAEFAVRLAN